MDPKATYRRVLPSEEWAALEAWLSTFYPFQLDWLLEPADYAICNKSRQIGISHTTSAVGVLWGAFHGELTTIISVGDRESAEVLDKARKHAGVLVKLGSRMAQTGKRDNASELSFASGGRILALPSTGGRSFTGNVFLDEFAYQEHASKVWDAAAAVTMLGGRMRVVSTPNGMGNDFEVLWRRAGDEGSGWVRHEIPIQKAIEQGYPVDIKKCWTLAKGDPRLYGQLFEGSFLDNELQYVPGELIDAARTDDLSPPGDGAFYAGLDIGKTVDLTVLVVVKKVNGVCYTQYIETHKRTDSDGLDALVARAMKRFDIRRLTVDATGLGIYPAERMQKRHGISKVEPFVFTNKSKEEIATALYQVFAEKKIRLPKTKLPVDRIDDTELKQTFYCEKGSPEKLRNDIAAIRREILPSGNIRYDAPHTDEGHADRAWALALAVHAAMTAPTYARLQ